MTRSLADMRRDYARDGLSEELAPLEPFALFRHWFAEAVKTDVSSSEAFSRVMEHLKANEVDTAKTKTVKGPLLKIDPKTEMFVGSEKTLIDAANNNPLRKRAGRGAFTIPQLA